jgi:hypothetical protein
MKIVEDKTDVVMFILFFLIALFLLIIHVPIGAIIVSMISIGLVSGMTVGMIKRSKGVRK